MVDWLSIFGPSHKSVSTKTQTYQNPFQVSAISSKKTFLNNFSQLDDTDILLFEGVLSFLNSISRNRYQNYRDSLSLPDQNLLIYIYGYLKIVFR